MALTRNDETGHLGANFDTDERTDSAPDVSFVIACFNSAKFLEQAVTSALRQTGVTVEILVIDDGSTDGSFAIAEALARSDSRVRTFRTPQNLGPGGARNLAIEWARGTWIAILDSDDLLHPDRSTRLIAEARASGADMIADDMLLFDDTRNASPSLFLAPKRARGASWIDLQDYLKETRLFETRANLGFLKPLIRRSKWLTTGVRYDCELRIAEDDALVVQLLRRGLRYRLLPEPLYFYRKHGNSVSHRLSLENLERMRNAEREFRDSLPAGDPALPAARRRGLALDRAHSFTSAIDALKARRPASALGHLVRNPGAFPLLRMPIAGAIAKRFHRLHRRSPPPHSGENAPRALIISRQRLVGATNGSSAYLLAVARAVRDTGFTAHLVQPTSAVFGRTPLYRLRPEMDVFETVNVNGARRVGRWMIALGPSIIGLAALAICTAWLRRLGLRHPLLADRPLPHSVSLPWGRREMLAVAAEGHTVPEIVIADYAFQSQAIPYVVAPKARRAIVMHDLFHTRAEQFAGASDSLTEITAEEEIAMLAAADAVIAIQQAEADFVTARVGGPRVILAPMPATSVEHPQIGQSDSVLFVGSNTAPNVLGLQWFVKEVWPAIATARPSAVLNVAGTVNRAFAGVPACGVRFLGLVPDLAPWYAEAGVVVSPLLHGSGLKIKLVEALAHGKACVATPTTLQGIETLATDAVRVADTPSAFARAVSELLESEARRTKLAGKALATARSLFDEETCMNAFKQWLHEA